MSLALRTSIPPSVWAEETPEAIVTAVDLIHRQDEAERRAARRG